MIDQGKIHKETRSRSFHKRREALTQLSNNFSALPDKKQAWEDIIRLAKDKDRNVWLGAAGSLSAAFPHIPDKEQAGDDLHRFTGDKNKFIRGIGAGALGAVFSYFPDKEQSWNDLHQLTQDEDENIRGIAAGSLGAAFPHIPDKQQAWEDLIRLAGEKDTDTRVSANYYLGKASIVKATEAKGEHNFQEELENAIHFFEISSNEAVHFNPAQFCYPFYRSFYTIIFKKQEAKKAVQNYLTEAKKALEGSEKKEKLIQVVEKLANALKDVKNGDDLNRIEQVLDTCRKQVEEAVDLIKTIKEVAPGATMILEKGLPFICRKIG
ncbi:MAG: hypothetical protein OIN83_00840 [Candidatus Methanoperedens sp.]|nr:hypothetical protein [Candidatus Methanoperedens sp.]